MALVELVRSGAVVTATINNPPVNAFSTAVWSQFRAVLSQVAADEDAAVMVLTAQGERVFSAGADVKEAASLPAADERRRRELVTAGLRQLGTLPIPIVCAINGPAIGGGLNIAALCDVRIASTNASFALPEINHGRHGGGGAFVRRLGVPAGVINEMLYMGRSLNASEALAVHLVNEVVSPNELMSRALQVAEAMSAKSRASLMVMKRAIQAAEATTDLWDAYDAAVRSAEDPSGMDNLEAVR